MRADAETIEHAADRLFWAIIDDVTAVGAGPSQSSLVVLEQELQRADERLQQALDPRIQDASGDAWSDLIQRRRADLDRARTKLGEARAADEIVETRGTAISLRNEWSQLDAAEKRQLIASRIDMLALRRTDKGLTVSAFLRGFAPEGISRRGFRRNPGLHPIDVPADSWTLSV